MIASRLSALVRLAGEVVRPGGSQVGSQRGCVLLFAVTAAVTILDATGVSGGRLTERQLLRILQANGSGKDYPKALVLHSGPRLIRRVNDRCLAGWEVQRASGRAAALDSYGRTMDDRVGARGFADSRQKPGTAGNHRTASGA